MKNKILVDFQICISVPLRYLNFCHVGKRFNKKPKVNFKLYDVTDPKINNYNTHIAYIA